MKNVLPKLLTAQTQLDQPARLFDAVENTCADLFGFTFLTILQTLPNTNNVVRVHSSTPDDYPVGALKPMGGTPWGNVVIDDRKTWLGNTPDEVLWAFPDAQLILSKGCEACACAPVIWNGTTRGILSLNAPRDSYAIDDVGKMSQIAQMLLPAFIAPPLTKKEPSE